MHKTLQLAVKAQRMMCTGNLNNVLLVKKEWSLVAQRQEISVFFAFVFKNNWNSERFELYWWWREICSASVFRYLVPQSAALHALLNISHCIKCCLLQELSIACQGNPQL